MNKPDSLRDHLLSTIAVYAAERGVFYRETES